MAKRVKIRHILDGSIITQDEVLRHWSYVIFLVCLAILLIANNYISEKIIRRTSKIEVELKELKTEHLAVLSEFLKKSQQTEIAKKADIIGVKESIVPPKKIIIRK